MFVLVARDPNGRIVASVKVTEEPQTIGRAPDSDLVLPSSGVSRTHASVYLHGDGVVVSDEGSANGVKVDGVLIEAPTLVDHTNRLQVSSFLLSLEPEAPVNGMPTAAEMAADTDEQVLDHDTRLEAHSGAATALANSVLELVGRGGPYAGMRFPIESLLLSVGRVDANDLVLDDPSVSRRHSQLRVSAMGDRLTVLDLRSHNGTFVDDQRIKRAEARLGAMIRFGDLTFELAKRRMGQTSGIKRRRFSGRQRVLMAVGGLMLILVVVGLVAYTKRPDPPPPPRKPVTDLLQDRLARIQARVEKARTLVSRRDWQGAEVELRGALEKDPLNTEAKRLQARVTEERGHERTFNEGMRFYAFRNRENLLKAQVIFEKIPKTSVYWREVRYRLKKIAGKVAEDYRIEGVSRCRARYWRRCQLALCKFFKVVVSETQVPGEPGLRRTLARAEKILRRRSAFVPCDAPRYLQPPGDAQQGDDPDALLSQRYPDVAPVRELLKVYIGGNIDGALQQLRKLRKRRRMRPHAATLSEVHRQLQVIHGKYQEGYSAYRERNVAEADRQWSVLLNTEASLLPKGLDSFYRRDVLRMSGDLYFELGEEQFKAKRYRVAARYWLRGNALNAKHARLLNGILQLEKTATTLIAEGGAAAAEGRIREARLKLTMARDICKPKSSTRGSAEQALGRLGH